MFRIGFRSLLERLMVAGFAAIAVLMAGSACDKVENKSEIKIEVNTGSVDYLGTVYLTWGGMNVSDCKLNGNSVEPNGSLIIENLKRDTSFTITGKGLSSELISSKADVKVGARTKYYDFLDTLCSGRWVCIQARELGIPIFGNKPNQWYITNRDVIGDWSNYVSFSGNSSSYFLNGFWQNI